MCVRVCVPVRVCACVCVRVCMHVHVFNKTIIYACITGYGITLYVGIAPVTEHCGAWSSFCSLTKHSK